MGWPTAISIKALICLWWKRTQLPESLRCHDPWPWGCYSSGSCRPKKEWPLVSPPPFRNARQSGYFLCSVRKFIVKESCLVLVMTPGSLMGNLTLERQHSGMLLLAANVGTAWTSIKRTANDWANSTSLIFSPMQPFGIVTAASAQPYGTWNIPCRKYNTQIVLQTWLPSCRGGGKWLHNWHNLTPAAPQEHHNLILSLVNNAGRV